MVVPLFMIISGIRMTRYCHKRGTTVFMCSWVGDWRQLLNGLVGMSSRGRRVQYHGDHSQLLNTMSMSMVFQLAPRLRTLHQTPSLFQRAPFCFDLLERQQPIRAWQCPSSTTHFDVMLWRAANQTQSYWLVCGTIGQNSLRTWMSMHELIHRMHRQAYELHLRMWWVLSRFHGW